MTGSQTLPPILAALAAWLLLAALAWWRWRAGALKHALHLDLLAVALLGVLNVAFFWQVLFDRAMMPRGGGDLVSFVYPMYAFASHALHSGQWPLWDPYLFSGAPFAADIQSGLYYPLNFLFERFAPAFGYPTVEALAMLHYLLAGVFCYAFARTLRASRPAALLAGIVYMWSGFMVAQLGHLNMVEVAAWLPLELLLLHLALGGVRRLLTVPLTSAVLAVAFFAGHTQLFLYELLALVLYAAFFGRWRSTVPTLAVVLGGAAVLAAVQILPSLQLTQLSLRADISYQQSTQFALAPVGLLTLLIPHFFGENSQNYWGSWTTTEVFGYAGIFPLLLAVAALRLRRGRQVRFFLWLGLLGILLSLGEATVLQGWLYRFVPGFDKVRAPGRFLVFFDLGVAMLAALGLDALREARVRTRATLRQLRLGTGAAAAAVAGIGLPAGYIILLTHQHEDAVIFHRLEVAVSGVTVLALLLLASLALLYTRRRGTTAFAAAAVILVVLDLGSSGYSFNPAYEDVLAPFRQDALLQALPPDRATYRVDSATNVDSVFPPDLPNVAGLQSIWGVFNPVAVADYYDFWKADVPGRDSRLYDLLGARYLLAKKGTPLPAKFQPLPLANAPFALYQDPSALPLAFVVGQTLGGTHAQALQTVRAPNFRPDRTAVLEGGRALGAAGGPWPASIDRQTDNELDVTTSAPVAGALVVTTVSYPGWHASVDGRPATLRRTDFVFQGLRVPAGRHVVRLWFDPLTWRLGLGISLVGWLVALATLALALWGPRGGGRWHFLLALDSSAGRAA